MTQQKTTKATLLVGTVIPLVLLSAPCTAAPLQTGDTLLAQQQEPAEKSDRPERRPDLVRLLLVNRVLVAASIEAIELTPSTNSMAG